MYDHKDIDHNDHKGMCDYDDKSTVPLGKDCLIILVVMPERLDKWA